METTFGRGDAMTMPSLKPSLVEWKLYTEAEREVLRVPLKLSLVEWKLKSAKVGADPAWPLKPSLVEWKHYFTCLKAKGQSDLETFLSGMETTRSFRLAAWTSTLKPSLVEWKRPMDLTASSMQFLP